MDVNQAFQLFNDTTKKKGLCPNVHIYTALMGGLYNLGNVDKALKLKMEMECKGMRKECKGIRREDEYFEYYMVEA